MDVAAFFFFGFFFVLAERTKKNAVRNFFLAGFLLSDPVKVQFTFFTVAILAQGKPSG
jgi:hypothetical protein